MWSILSLDKFVKEVNEETKKENPDFSLTYSLGKSSVYTNLKEYDVEFNITTKAINNWRILVERNRTNCSGLYMHGFGIPLNYSSAVRMKIDIDLIKWITYFSKKLLEVDKDNIIQCSISAPQSPFYTELAKLEEWEYIPVKSKDRSTSNRFYYMRRK